MLFHSSRRSLTKLIVLAAVVTAGIVCALGAFARRDLVEASSSGPPPSHTNAPLENNCTECHTSFPVNSGTGGVTINGLPARYSPGQQVPVTVTVSQSDAVIYGFQLTVIE